MSADLESLVDVLRKIPHAMELLDALETAICGAIDDLYPGRPMPPADKPVVALALVTTALHISVGSMSKEQMLAFVAEILDKEGDQ